MLTLNIGIEKQIKKAPDIYIQGPPCILVFFYEFDKCFVMLNSFLFSHPDYTVGSGISPDQPFLRLTDFLVIVFSCQNHRRSGICIYRITLPRSSQYLFLNHSISFEIIMQAFLLFFNLFSLV